MWPLLLILMPALRKVTRPCLVGGLAAAVSATLVISKPFGAEVRGTVVIVTMARQLKDYLDWVTHLMTEMSSEPLGLHLLRRIR